MRAPGGSKGAGRSYALSSIASAAWRRAVVAAARLSRRARRAFPLGLQQEVSRRWQRAEKLWKSCGAKVKDRLEVIEEKQARPTSPGPRRVLAGSSACARARA